MGLPILRSCIILTALIAQSCAISKYIYEIKTIEVPLDHFSFANNLTFQLRYLINDTYAASAVSPILFYTGNEGDIELFAANTGFIWENAPDLGAIIVFAEHRYYGKSLPFGNKSYDSPAHLGYLTSEQALADYSLLLEKINPKKNFRQRPVIAIGGSYGGMLAAWFRMKYPHIVHGALAASAPILQFGDLTPCNVYSQIVSSVFQTAYKPQCAYNVKESFNTIKKLIATPEGRSTLNSKFHFCTNLTKPEDEDTFVDFLTDVYGNLAMVNYPYSTSFLAPLPAYPVRQFCYQFSAKTNETSVINDLASALNVYTNFTGTLKCLDISSAYDSNMGDAGWDFQACSEMVMPMCSSITDDYFDMFPKVEWDLNKYSDKCFKKYGVRPRPNAAIRNYGGDSLKDITNIIFSNGMSDPWSGGGVLRAPNEHVQIIIIPEGAHHIDLRESNKNDPEVVTAARKAELQTIKMWLKHF